MAIKTDMITAQYRVTDMALAETFYTRLIGRGPDFRASPTFLEWELIPGYWLQLSGHAEFGSGGPLRWRVDDIVAGRAELIVEHGLDVGEIGRLEGVVAYCNFEDPFGNPLGIFQDLAR